MTKPSASRTTDEGNAGENACTDPNEGAKGDAMDIDGNN